MARRGRPIGSGYDDRARIARVRDAMASGRTRRAAILITCGLDQLRRIEIKMRMADMSEERGRTIAQSIHAGLIRMGWRDGRVTVEPLRPSAHDETTRIAMAAEAQRLGFTLITGSEREVLPV